MARVPGPSDVTDAGVPSDAGAMRALGEIQSWLVAEIDRLDREAAEIELLEQQTRVEAERHRARRTQCEDRVTTLEADPASDKVEVVDARKQLLEVTRRATLMEAQSQVLEGKQKTLQRYRTRMDALGRDVQAAVTGRGSAPSSVVHRSDGDGAESALAADTPRAVLHAQEDLRRDIARQMHDGPAQSLANIALQAEIVQRLMSRDPARAAVEVEQLRTTVQHALEATKTFIFDVRPMVLDDLGLVPTLRRAAADRGQRAGVQVEFDSVGADQRLSPDLETSFFRIVDDALAGYLSLRPSAISVRLEWSDTELHATVRSGRPDERAAAGRSGADVRKTDASDMPPALAAMIAKQRADEREVWASARTLPADRWRDIQSRAEAVGVTVTLLDDGQTLEAMAKRSG